MPLIRRLILAVALVFGAHGLAVAAEREPFTQAKFDAAVAASNPVLVEVWASWCPVCQAQNPIIESLLKQPDMAKLVVLGVDFDKDRETMRKLGATRQSTLIAFKAGKEVDRSLGDTTAAGIERLMRKAL